MRSGLQFGEQVEILEGLADGDQVVTKGFLGLRAGLTVRVVNPATNANPEANSKTAGANDK